MEHATARSPYLDAPHDCKQIQPIAELSGVVRSIDDKMEQQADLLKKLVDGFDQIRVLAERDLRREKDVEIAFTRIREMEKDLVSTKLKMEGLVVKMGIIGGSAVLVGGVFGGILVKYFGG